MPAYIKDKTTLKRFIDTETKQFKFGKGVKGFIKRHNPLSESAILCKHIIFLRKAEYHKNTNHKIRGLYYRIKLISLQRKYSMHIPLNVFDEGLRIMHLGSILVNNSVIAGKNCTLHMNTAIVSSANAEPILGDGVWMGFGSCVSGGVKIGNFTAIGAGAVVVKSFEEENITIAGVPAKKISDEGTLNWGKK